MMKQVSFNSDPVSLLLLVCCCCFFFIIILKEEEDKVMSYKNLLWRRWTNRTLGHNLRSGQDVIGKSEDFGT